MMGTVRDDGDGVSFVSLPNQSRHIKASEDASPTACGALAIDRRRRLPAMDRRLRRLSSIWRPTTRPSGLLNPKPQRIKRLKGDGVSLVSLLDVPARWPGLIAAHRHRTRQMRHRPHQIPGLGRAPSETSETPSPSDRFTTWGVTAGARAEGTLSPRVPQRSHVEGEQRGRTRMHGVCCLISARTV